MRAIPDRGDVILLSFDPTSGHEQAGFRPAVVLSPEYYNKGYPFEVILDGTKKTIGVALADQVRSVDWQSRKIKIVDRVSMTSLATILAKFKPLLF
jgi:mRNA interferase MazF